MKLEDLKAGDAVIVKAGNYDIGRLSEVEKITKSHIIVEGQKYRKMGGAAVGVDSWSMRHIAMATPEAIA